ncbi:MAG: adenylyl-sulfate kinase [Desulfovibrio sp.]|nr:adenylyl-sulfate kinase [Desulfovibrio sp.]
MEKANAETLIVPDRRLARLREEALNMPSLFLDEKARCDLELLLNRGYAPLRGYATSKECEAILSDLRLPDGTFWPIPVVLSFPRAAARDLAPGRRVALRDREGFMLAALSLTEIWEPDPRAWARAVYGTDRPGRHPEADRLLADRDAVCLAGPVEGLSLPQHYDFVHLRHTPAQARRLLAEGGRRPAIGFQDAAPLHVMHRETLLSCAAEHGARLFISPLLPAAHFTEVASFSTVRCYESFVRHMPPHSALLCLTAMRARQAGPRGAMLQALVNRNYGCTHFLVHERHDDPFAGDGKPFYPPWAALQALEEVKEGLGVTPLPFRPRRYVPEFSLYLDPRDIRKGIAGVEVGHADLERRLDRGEGIPEWYAFPEVVRELRRTRPPAHRMGFTLFLTGLSGAGKSTLAKVLFVMLQECQDRPVSLLDGDIVRRHLSSELTFSREHRNLNVRRMGYVASEITKNRGIALCAPIAPYPESRLKAREIVSQWGPFIEIYVSTPLAVCEQRDRKGLYAKARAGILRGVTGVDDPYLPPENPELAIDTSACTPREAALAVLRYLEGRGLVRKAAGE